MNDGGLRTQTDLDELIGELAEEYAQRLRDGEKPDVEEYTRRHPEAAEAIRQILPALEIMGAVPGKEVPFNGEPPFSNGQNKALGDFEIVREIGRGGMGVVYEARQLSLSRRVALKVLPFAAVLDERQIQRFRNEALAAAQLDHPHIVNVYGVGCERSVHFYAMRYVEGDTLAEVTAELRRLQKSTGASPPVAPGSEADDAKAVAGSDNTPALAALSTQRSASGREFFRSVARIGVEVAEALDHAHQQGVIHRDIKPANVIIDATGKSWVTDFGLARMESGATLTMTGDLLGTLRYMSPEQALAKRVVVDHRTDVYSLGITLYELLTLQPAYGDEDRHELLRKIAFEEPKPPRKLNRAVPEELETIVLKAIAKNPNDRYETAQEFADDLQRYLDDKPIRAKRPGIVQIASKWIRRHRGASSVVVLAVLLIIVAFSLLIVHQRHQLALAEAAATHLITEARVAIAGEEYGRAAGMLADWQQRIVDEPRLATQFGPEIEDLLQEAAVQLRVQRFDKAVEEARFQAIPHIKWDMAERFGQSSYTHPPRNRLDGLRQARTALRDTLEIFRVLSEPEWRVHLNASVTEWEQHTAVLDDISELLLLLSYVEFGLGEAMQAEAVQTRVAIELLDKAEEVDPDVRALYEYRSIYFRALGDELHATADEQLAQTVKSSRWVDHFLLALKLWTESEEFGAVEELEAALAVRVDDYWTWHLYSRFQHELRDFEAAEWGANVCIGLRPQEGTAYVDRAHARLWRGAPSEDALSDLNRAIQLPLTGTARAYALAHRGLQLRNMGHPEAAFEDFNRAVELNPDDEWYRKERAWTFHALGQTEAAYDDARKILELVPVDDSNSTTYQAEYQVEAYRILYDPRELVKAVDLYLAVERDNVAVRSKYLGYQASAFIELQQFDDARRSLERLSNESSNDPYWWYIEAILGLATEDNDAYLATCERIVEQIADGFSELKQSNLEFIPWTVALIPNAVADFSNLNELVEHLLERSGDRPSILKSVGALSFRAGRNAEALRLLNLAEEKRLQNVPSSSPAYTWYFLSMTHAALGTSEDAEEWLQKANAQAESELNAATPPSWNRKLTLELLRAEAEGMVGPLQISPDESD